MVGPPEPAAESYPAGADAKVQRPSPRPPQSLATGSRGQVGHRAQAGTGAHVPETKQFADLTGCSTRVPSHWVS